MFVNAFMEETRWSIPRSEKGVEPWYVPQPVRRMSLQNLSLRGRSQMQKSWLIISLHLYDISRIVRCIETAGQEFPVTQERAE